MLKHGRAGVLGYTEMFVIREKRTLHNPLEAYYMGQVARAVFQAHDAATEYAVEEVKLQGTGRWHNQLDTVRGDLGALDKRRHHRQLCNPLFSAP